MAHHKRGRSKTQRAGSSTGHKRFKLNGIKGTKDARPPQVVRADQALQPQRRVKRRRGKKPWTVEYRTRPEIMAEEGRGMWGWLDTPDWTIWRRYATETARDDAMREFARRVQGGDRFWPWWDCEFRVGHDR